MENRHSDRFPRLRLRGRPGQFRRMVAVPILLLLAGAAEAAGKAEDPLAVLVSAVRRSPGEWTYSDLALFTAREVYPDLDAARRAAFENELDRLAGLFKARADGARTGREKLELLNTVLFREVGLTKAPESVPEHENPDHYFPHAALAGKQGTCLGLSLIYLAVGERVRLPLYAVHAPQHIYVRYYDGREEWNVEPTRAGLLFDETAFKARYGIGAEALAKGPYFRLGGKLQVLGDLLNSLAWFSAIRTAARPLPPERAVLAARLCVEIGPQEFNNWDTLAQALSYAGRPQEALAALRRTLELRPPVSGLLGASYWEDRLRRFTAAAQAASPVKQAAPKGAP